MPIQDPRQSDMERRLLVAMALSMIVLFLVPYFYQRIDPTPPPPPPPELEQAETVEEKRVAESEVRSEEPREQPSETPLTQADPQTVEVENDQLILRWSNVGAVLESALLKEYTSQDGTPLQMIPSETGTDLKPFALKVSSRQLSERLANVAFEVQGAPEGGKIQTPAEITFRYRDAEIAATRTIRIFPHGYLLEMETRVDVAGSPSPFSVFLGPGIGGRDPVAAQEFASPQITYYSAGSAERYSPDDLREAGAVLPPGTRWAAIDSMYFAYLLLEPDGLQGGRLFQPTATPSEEPATALLGLEVALGEEQASLVFIGPKDYEVLYAADSTLPQLIDYGWFAFLVKPLLLMLKFIYEYVGNYGWAIILLTFVINLALFPIRFKQMTSMKKMAALQPQMKSIQEKYKRMKRDDPRRQKMNEEVMALYKAHGVNPLGGCLPLLVQFPFLIAFYSMLYSSIELRGAPFILWIDDLSRHDPYYVTPILMGASMVVQQKMTPGVADPVQQRMMMILPVVFTFFFLNFSSGLVLYFLFSNLFGMMFQLLIQKWSPEKALRPRKAS